MKKFFRYGAVSAVVAASMGMSTAAQAQDSATAGAFAEILTALEMSLDTGSKLDFGAMVVSGAGVVTLDASDGTVDCTDADIVCSGTTEFAAYSITAGTAGKGVTINFGAPSVTLLRSGGTSGTAADELELDNFNSDATLVPDDAGDYYEVTLGSTGTATFEVGGDLNFDGTEVAGVYSGTFSVSVEYS